MYTSFPHAPCGQALKIEKINSVKLAEKLTHMGVFDHSQVFRMDAETNLHTVRIKTSHGETVLSGGMGGKIVVHLDNGNIIPLTEMKPGETGHIEAVEGGEELLAAFNALGLENNEEISLIRSLPPMEYIIHVENKGRVRLSEGMAAKILGTQVDSPYVQFANARTGVPFTVKQVIGGRNAQKIMNAFGIKANDILTLQYVENASSYHMTRGERYILSTHEGLRVYLSKEQAEAIIISYE